MAGFSILRYWITMNLTCVRVVSILVAVSFFAGAPVSAETKEHSNKKEQSVALSPGNATKDGQGKSKEGSADPKAQTAGKRKGCYSELVVNATPEAVFKAIINLREDEHETTVKEISREGNHCIIEEKFDGLPIVGEATCVYKEVYEPFRTISYNMVKSDKFQAFEGCWSLTPLYGGSSTKVSLSAYVVCDIPVPFAKQLTKLHTMLGVRQRLHEVKKECENKSIATK